MNRRFSFCAPLALAVAWQISPAPGLAQAGPADSPPATEKSKPTVEFSSKIDATLDAFKKMSDGSLKIEFTIRNKGEYASLSTHGLSDSQLCEISLLDLSSNKRYFPLRSPEGCVASRSFENTLKENDERRLWVRFPKLPEGVKIVSLDLKAATFDDLAVPQ